MIYRILVVEDEEIVRKSIIGTLVSWDKFQLEVKEASCGFEGVDMAQSFKPHIILTDIMMPGLDGLKMIAKIRDFLSQVRCLILSGYDDFEFARDAIELKVSSYLLKPFDDEELFEKMEQLLREIEEAQERELLKSRFEKDLVRRKFIKKLLCQDSGNVLPVAGKRYDLSFSCRYYRCASIEVKRLAPEDKEYFYTASLDFFNSALSALQTFLVCMNEEKSEFALLYGYNLPPGQVQEIQYMEQYRTYIRRRFHADALIGMGTTVHGPSEFYKSFRQAKLAKEQVFFSSDGRTLIYYDALESSNRYLIFRNKVHMHLAQLSSQINSACINHNYAETERLLAQMKNVIQSYSDMGMEEALEECERLIFMLYSTATEYTGKDYRSVENDTKQQIRECATIFQVFKVLHQTTNAVWELIPYNGDNDNYVVTKMKKIIKNSYKDGITLKEIADSLGYSQNYLGMLFAQTTGRKFNVYLQEYRIEQAKKLLSGTKLNMKQISEQIGLGDITYFSTLFKKVTGLTPSEYRKLNS